MTLIILDGWGYSEMDMGNAIKNANKPVWDGLWEQHPHALIRGSGVEVGLPANQMGNSEVGHLNLGAGRVVCQEVTRINQALKSAAFFSNEVLIGAADLAGKNDQAVHILGLLSHGGVHSQEDHIIAMVELAAQRGVARIYLHAFLDGRDSPPKSAADSIRKVEQTFARLGRGRFASIIGRYYAMDRDHRWERTAAAYNLISAGQAGYHANDAQSALQQAYDRGEGDEFVAATAILPPTLPTEQQRVQVNDGDVIIFMNYRADRARQITSAFIDPRFDGFRRERLLQPGRFVTLTRYSTDFDVPVAFSPILIDNVFGEYISHLGLKQLRIAETEKYAHVTFFLNGDRERPFAGEERILIPSPSVATYDLQPSMNAPVLTDRLIEAVEGGRYDVIICNYANADMVGHTGNYHATIKAIETIDGCLERVVAAIRKAGGEVLITADHGNAEQMCDPNTGQAHTAHTSNPVPFIYIGRTATIEASGILSDIVPTMLYLMNLEIPVEMQGHPLVTLLP